MLSLATLRCQIDLSSDKKKFFQHKWTERNGMYDNLLTFTMRFLISLSVNAGKSCSRYCQFYQEMFTMPLTMQTPEDVTHQEINPSQGKTCDRLPRKSYTKLGFSEHNFARENGRWNRSGCGRLPVEQLICVGDRVQTERHTSGTSMILSPYKVYLANFRMKMLIRRLIAIQGCTSNCFALYICTLYLTNQFFFQFLFMVLFFVWFVIPYV